MAPRSFSSDAQEMSTSESSGSRAMAQPVDITESEDEQTYGSASESGSESSVGGNWGTKRMDIDPLLQAEEPGEENLFVLARTAKSLRDSLENELKLRRSSFHSAEHQNPMDHPVEVNMEKALGISTQLSTYLNLMEKHIKDTQNENETNLHEASMARKEAERAAKEAQAQMELLQSEHDLTLMFENFEYKERRQELETELAVEKIKSTAMEKRLKDAECLLLAKSDANAELKAKVHHMESRVKDLEIMKSIAERRLLGESKRRKKAVKAALDSAEADLSRKADSFRKTYLISALDILKRQYPNLDLSLINNGDLLGTDNTDSLDPQPSRIALNTNKETASESES